MANDIDLLAECYGSLSSDVLSTEQPLPDSAATRSTFEELPSELITMIVDNERYRTLIRVRPDFDLRKYSTPTALALAQTSRRLHQKAVSIRGSICSNATFSFGSDLTEQDIRQWLQYVGPAGVLKLHRVLIYACVRHEGRRIYHTCHRRMFLTTAPHPQACSDAWRVSSFPCRHAVDACEGRCRKDLLNFMHKALGSVPKWPDGGLKLNAESFLAIWQALHTDFDVDS